ncbi:MAG: alpha/beta hydrolase [Armatimonadetes bacterium]|nr:alpha/beta hydrolase [Armatimonadota bacterium]
MVPLELHYVHSAGTRILAVVRGEPGRPTVIFADPFAEEKKCAHRVMSECAMALAEAGITAVRFDYRGCGDSDGDFHEYTLSDWRSDISTIADWAAATLRPSCVAFLGVRLGATLVAQAVESGLAADALVLVAPITNGTAYWQENFRRQLIRAKLTAGDHVTADQLQAAEQEEFFDLGGWLVSRAMRGELQALSLEPPGYAPRFSGPCLVVDVAPRDQPGPQAARLAAAYAAGKAIAVRMEPFWQRIGLIRAEPLVAALTEWLPLALRIADDERATGQRNAR